MEAIDADQPEGIYLRRYHSLPSDKIPSQLHRIRWYRDLTDALCHIHSLGIAHADVRIDNVLFDEQDSAILCDFSAASPLGQPNPVFPDLPLPVNGPSPALSETTDMFAMGSLIFQIEHEVKPELSVDSRGTLVLPKIRTDHQSLDTIIRKAWLGHYNRTSEMLEDLNSIDTNGACPANDIKLYSGSTESLGDRIRKWRECRENKFGKGYPLHDVYIVGR
jgi:serine/threonine protein kinase